MDPYKILGITENATDAEIKKAYHTLAKKYHPDRNTKTEYDDERFKEINKAYYLLINGKYKKGSGFKFDELLSQFSSFDFSALSKRLYTEAAHFTKFFNEKHPNGLSTERKTTENIIYNLNINIQDIYYGVLKTLTISRKRKCKKCLGLGIKIFNDNGEIVNCDRCNGNKYIDVEKDFTIDSSEKTVCFFGESNEAIDKYTGNIIFNINPRYDEYDNLYILNNYDLLYQLFIDKTSAIPDSIKLFNENIQLNDIKVNIMNKIQNKGLIKESIEIRGDLFIQIIYHNI